MQLRAAGLVTHAITNERCIERSTKSACLIHCALNFINKIQTVLWRTSWTVKETRVSWSKAKPLKANYWEQNTGCKIKIHFARFLPTSCVWKLNLINYLLDFQLTIAASNTKRKFQERLLNEYQEIKKQSSYLCRTIYLKKITQVLYFKPKSNVKTMNFDFGALKIFRGQRNNTYCWNRMRKDG